MFGFLILGISILLQFTAAIFALRLIRVTGKRWVWGLIALAVCLMGVRRSITFYRLMANDLFHSPDLLAETIALLISTLMVLGISRIAPIFYSIEKSSEALRDSEAKLNEAQHMAQIGSWDLDLTTNTLSWSDEVYRIFDFEPQQFQATYEAFLDRVHPDDRAKVDKTYTDSLKNKLPYDVVHRLLTKEGKIKFVNERCETFYNDAGKALRSIGTVQDITERKRAEEKIAWFVRIFEDSLNEIYLFKTESLKFVQVNSAAQHNLGYTIEELRKLTPLHLKPELTEASFERLITPLRKEKKGKIVFETVHKRKDQSLYDVEVHLQLLKHEGEALFVAIILDITERKQAARSALN